MTPQQKFKSPLSIPEGKIGDYAITHEVCPAGHVFSSAHSFRNQMFGGQKDVKFSWPHPVTIHRLTGPTGVWMSDLPVEVAQMQAAIKGMRGRVLIGGLGLGLAASLLAVRKSVREVVVVEISKEVVDLVLPWIDEYNKKIEVVNNDLFEYLKCCPAGKGEAWFDSALFDIWQSDGEATFFETVCPLYEASRGKVKHAPAMWNESVMRGQLVWSIQSRLMFQAPMAQQALGEQLKKQPPPWEEIGSIFWDFAVPFFEWWKAARPEADTANAMASYYAGVYGTWGWRAAWERLARFAGAES